MLIPCDEVNILNTFRVMIILRLLLLLTNLHLKLLSTQGTGADKLLSTQRVNTQLGIPSGQMDMWSFVVINQLPVKLLNSQIECQVGSRPCLMVSDELKLNERMYSYFIG